MAAGVTYSGSDHNSASLPLLMEHTSSSASNQEHLVVNVSSVRPTIPIAPHGDVSRSVDAQEGTSSSSREAQIDGASTSAARANFGRHGDLRHYRRRQRTSPLNSGLWISIEFTITLCQIIASVVVLAVSRHEKPEAPLFAWIIGYAAGCLATLPHLYWRYRHRYSRPSEQDPSSTSFTSRSHSPQDPPYTAMSIPEDALEEGRGNSQVSQDNSDSVARTRRVGVVIERFKMALDCFFAVWFVVGNVWIFGSRSSAHHAPNLYRLCIVFLTFSCIGYAMPFILCGTICCCLPCIISILGLREDQSQTRGASTEVIDSMPKYKFKERKLSERVGRKDDSGTDSESSCNGGIIGSGTETERSVSGEDAVCCICLGRYKDGEDLRELPCLHFFHVDCVDKWLKINASCPLCKHEIGETEGALESNGNSGLQRGSQT